MIENAVLVAAGLGIRLLPATKEQPKEMLPVYAQSARGGVCLKPLLQLIFEQLYAFSNLRDTFSPNPETLED
jgi:UTP--glucose-1-phosphate uridylyltransferase